MNDRGHASKVILVMEKPRWPSQIANGFNIMRMRIHLRLTKATFLILLIAFGFACRNITGQAITPVTGEPVHNTAVAIPVLYMPPDSLDISYNGLSVNSIRKFYLQRQERLFWTSNHKAVATADSLISFITNIRYYGLLPDTYHYSEIQKLKDGLSSPEHIFRFEALLTNAFVSLVQHISFGRTALITDQSDSAALFLLQRASEQGGLVDNLTSMESSLPAYQSLKRGLRLLIDSLSVEQRQAVLLNSPAASDVFITQIQTIEVNLERFRLEKTAFGSRYILVNIPAFMLYLVENDSVIMKSRIIVGTPDNPTPQLSSTIDCFITYPYWHVPRKIAIEEYLPVIQRDITFLTRNNFDILDKNGNVLNPDSLDWKKFNENYFPVRLRQREGTENALGIIKFSFDNPYAVFLHDTNAKRLFRSSVRAFSHGCIRMEKAVELSHYLVTGDLNKKSKWVERFLKEESRHTVELQKPIPIHVRYYTCDFDGGGLNFYGDIYKKDRMLAEQLNANILTSDL